MTIYKRKSKEYKQYIDGVIAEYNSNGKKTLLFVCDNGYPIVDGVWRVLENCTGILSNYPNYNVLIMAPDFKGDVYVNDVPVLGVRSKYLKFLQYQCALPMFDAQLKKLTKKLKIDLIHCHSPFLCGQFAKKIHKKRKIPMVATFHSQYKKDFLKSTKSKAISAVCMKIIMRVFNSADEVWTMHTASRDTLLSYGYKGKYRLMPNATSLKPLGENYAEVRESFRQKYRLQGKTAFIFVGRLITQKGLLFIVDVLSLLRKQNVPFKMFFIGDGPDRERLKNKIFAEKLNDDVILLGNIMEPKELAECYAGADLFLFPSLYDVSSIVQIESATYKTPVVFAEGSVTSCTATNNVNGYLLPYDVQKYTQGVIDIINGGTIEQVGENALRDLHVEWENIVAESAKVYDEIMNTYETSKVK